MYFFYFVVVVHICNFLETSINELLFHSYGTFFYLHSSLHSLPPCTRTIVPLFFYLHSSLYGLPFCMRTTVTLFFTCTVHCTAFLFCMRTTIITVTALHSSLGSSIYIYVYIYMYIYMRWHHDCTTSGQPLHSLLPYTVAAQSAPFFFYYFYIIYIYIYNII